MTNLLRIGLASALALALAGSAAAQRAPTTATTVFRVGEMQAKRGKGAELYAIMKRATPSAKTTRGLLSFEVLRSVEDPDKLSIVERWTSIEAHKASVKLIPKGEIAKAKAILATPPTGGYFQP